MAILEFVNNVYEGFESNEYTIGIFLDLMKTFDTVRDSLTTTNFKKKLKLHFLSLNWTSAGFS